MNNKSYSTTIAKGTIEFHTPNSFLLGRAKNAITSEPETICWLDSIRDDEVLFDVGANVGNFAVYAGKLNATKTIAFEPEASNFSILSKNIRLNNIQDFVTAYPIAIGTANFFSNLYLAREMEGWACNSVGENLDPYLKKRNNDIVQGTVCLSLDFIVSQLKITPAYLKIDVDGLELDVLRSATHLLDSPELQSVLIELNPCIPEHQEALALLEEKGFVKHAELSNATSIKEGTFKGMCNFIFHRNKERLEEIATNFFGQQPSINDIRIDELLRHNKVSELSKMLSDAIMNKPNLVSERKYSFKSLLHNSEKVFRDVYSNLDKDRCNGLNIVKNCDIRIDQNEQALLKDTFEKRLSDDGVLFTRIDGRRRRFVSLDELAPTEVSIVQKAKAFIDQQFLECFPEKILYESIEPIGVSNVNTTYWHIDSLADLIKVVIPLNEFSAENAPMMVSDFDRAAPKQYFQKLHTIYKIAGLNVAQANYFEDDQVKTLSHVTEVLAKPFEVFLFNPQIVHSGSICRVGVRQSITIYFRLNSIRNRALSALN